MSSHPADSRPRRWPSLLAQIAGWLVVVVYVAGVTASNWLERSAGLPNRTPVDDAVLQVGFGAFAVVGALLVADPQTPSVGSWPPSQSWWQSSTRATPAHSCRRGSPGPARRRRRGGRLDRQLVLVPPPRPGRDLRSPFVSRLNILPSRRWLPVAVLPGIGTVVVVIYSALVPVPEVNEASGYEIENPMGIKVSTASRTSLALWC